MKKIDSKFRNQLAANAVAQLFRDLKNSTWGENNEEALCDLVSYREDIATTISKEIFVQNDKEQTLARDLISDVILSQIYRPNPTSALNADALQPRDES